MRMMRSECSNRTHCSALSIGSRSTPSTSSRNHQNRERSKSRPSRIPTKRRYISGISQSPAKPVAAGKSYWLELSPTERVELGDYISAHNLASQVVEFWAKQLGVRI